MLPLPLSVHRDRRGFSQEELARRAGVSEKTIWSIEQGRHRPFGSTRRAIAKALGVDILAITEFADGGDGGEADPT